MSLALVPQQATHPVEPQQTAAWNSIELSLGAEYHRVVSYRPCGFGLVAHMDLPGAAVGSGPPAPAHSPTATEKPAARPRKSTLLALRSRLARRLQKQSRWIDAFAILFFALTTHHLLSTPFRFAPLPEGRLVFDGISVLAFILYYSLRVFKES